MTGSAVSLHCAMLGSPVMKLAPMGSVSPAGVPSSLRHSVSSLSSLVSSAESGFTLTMDERKPFYSIRLVNFQRLREREKKKKKLTDSAGLCYLSGQSRTGCANHGPVDNGWRLNPFEPLQELGRGHGSLFVLEFG